MLATSVPAEITTAFVQLGLILLGLSLLARAANRAGFSPIPLYLLGGLAADPLQETWTAAVVGGGAHETGQLLLPRFVRRSWLWRKYQAAWRIGRKLGASSKRPGRSKRSHRSMHRIRCFRRSFAI